MAGSIYRVGLAITALEEPTRLLDRLPRWILAPLIRLYYGAADTSICLPTARLDDRLEAVLAAPV